MARVSFEDVLGTNYLPTQTERRLIATLIKSKEQELTYLNDISAPLLAERDILNDEILAHRALLTPARGLIPELVREIFTHSVNYIPPGEVQENIYLYRFAKPSVNEAPLVLGRICRCWRQIALSTQSLWSTISIPRGFSTVGIQEWISRAGSCNLSFTLSVQRANIDVSKILASYQQRWSDVVLGFTSFDKQFWQQFVKALSPEYENLQILEICGWSSRITSLFNMPLAIGSAPNLRQLIIRDPSFKFTALHDWPPLCLQKINVIGWKSMLATDSLALLRCSPAVQVINTNVLYTFDQDENHRDIIDLRALKSIDITLEYHLEGNQNLCVLEQIYAPALEELSLRIERFWGPYFYAPQIRSLIHRSSPPLKVLHVCGCQLLSPYDIVECLPFLPLLSILRLEQLGGQLDGVINALTGPIPPFDNNLSGCMCPGLMEIHLSGNNDLVLDSELVINMILSRSPAGASKLAHVTVPQKGSLLEADPRIIECIANGLKLCSSGPWETWESGDEEVDGWLGME